MKRVLIIFVGFALAAVGALAAAGAGGDGGSPTYTIALDNAFGLTVGSDLKVAGVRAGTIKDIRLDEKSHDALVDVQLTATGFGDLRTDAFCESRPQSLIGEYYLDCAPGEDPEKLEDGGRIPIEQTGSTVPADLVTNIMRRPYRERLRIILSQLGVGVAARGDELNDAIRRASPALRETDRVLAILADQNTTLQDLVTDADTVLDDLSGNRRDVARWVQEAGATAADSAERRAEIAAGLERLPGFLEELEPTMVQLGRATDAQTPALENLDASADRLEQLFTQLQPFSSATQVNLRSLGGAARIGRDAVRDAGPVVDELNRFSVDTPELAQNLRIVLEDLDDRDRAIEDDPRSPGGQGYTGLEGLLQYTYDQSMAINIFDANGYILKANLFESECSDFQNEETIAKKIEEDPGFIDRCAAWLGPNQQGVIQPDPTKPDDAGTRRGRRARRDRGDSPLTPAPTTVPVSADPAPGADTPAAAGTPTAEDPLVPLVDDVVDNVIPPDVDANPQDLLDFLLKP